uniref:ATP-binding cassette, sub-family A (ABC1), member 12 n=1 Tax=Cyprinus carpio carpio TaxID=630221 RepID=A0A9J7YRV5_CYPCA
MSYAQASTLTQETIQMVDAVIHTLLPVEAVMVLVPIKNSILSYLNNISQPAGFDQWNELIINMMTELQNSLPSNNTAQPIISMIIKVTENLLSSNEVNFTKDWIINKQLTIALDRIFQGNVSSVDLAGAGVNLEQLLQAMAPLLSPEDRAFLAVAEQVSQTLTYALHVSSTDGGLQSENFTEAVISTVRAVLESISNETGALPQDVFSNILGAFNGSLQLILNSNMRYAQARTLTQETIQMVDAVIHILLPAELAEVLVPIKNSILSYLNNISQPAGFDQWNELIMNVLTELQNSLPSNNTAQPIISMIIKVTENLLSLNEGNLTRDWIINQQLTIALDRIFQGNVSSVDLAGAGVNLDQLLQAMAPLLSPEDRAFLAVAEQVSQTLTYALHVSSTDGGLQSENFTEAVISTVRVVLESISNETKALPQDVINNILGAFNGSLQLILNPNMGYAQTSTLTQETIQMVDAVIHTLLPAEAVVVLVPIKNSILSYLNNISQPAGFNQWNELIMIVLTELQNSLPSNNTAQPIISMIIKVTENLLSSNEGNLTRDWIINQQLTIALDRIFQGNVSSVDLAGAGVNLDQLLQAMAPLLSPEDRAFLAVAEQVSQTLTYALHLSSTDGGFQSENFTEAVISTVRVVLESISNETKALPQDVVNNILGAFNGSLQLILNSNMSYAQTSTLTQETIQMVDAVIHTLLPAEAVVVLVPIKNSILSYLNNISQPAGFDQWNELIMHVLTELQNSLPSNNTAQPIISMIIKVTENLLSSNEGNLTRDLIINQQLTIAFHRILKGNVSSVDLAGAGVNLDQLLQTMAPLLSPEDRAFLAVAEQVSQTLTYALNVSSTDGGLQSENFTEAVISTVRVVLESISNETGALPQDVVNNILGAFNGSLQLILNPNMRYAQTTPLTQETIQMADAAIHTLLPVEVAKVLVPIKNSILSYLNNISQPAGFDQWDELIKNMMTELQNSLPSNNTAQPIISMIIKVTENLLSSNEGSLTKDWIINQQVTMALAAIFQGNFSSVDLAGAGVNLDQLLQAMAPLLSPEDRAFLAVAEQVSQMLIYTLHVSSTDGGLQSENFTEAVISTVRAVLESISNETKALPQDVVNNILGAFNRSIQLILNPNLYYMQANHLTQDTVQMLGGAIHGLLPAEVAEVLVPIKNSILAYLQTISQSTGPDKWNEVIVNMMRELQNSLPSNNTAQPIISVILKVTEYILNSNEGYTNMWHNLGNLSLGNLNEITEQLAVFLGTMSPFMNESAQTVTESVGVLVQILSGSADQLTFDKLEDMLAALFSTFEATPMWDSLPTVVSTIQQAIVISTHNMQAQTDLLYVLQQPLSNLLSGIFHVMNTSSFTSHSFVGGLPQALVSTAEAALQAGLGGQSLNCSYLQQIWQDVRAGSGSEDTVALWCNISLLPVIAAFDKPAPAFNMTGMAMNPLWKNATAGMMAESLETFYGAILNSTFASNHLTEVLLHYTSMLSNLSVLELTNQADWNVQLFQMQLYQSLSSVQMALDQITREAPWMTPYIEAAGKTIEVILQNGILLQNSTASPQIIMQALEITLTGMNFTKETINYILSGDIFMNPNRSTVDSLIKEVIQQIIGTGLLRDWPTLYGIMQQVLYLEDTSGTLWKTVEFFNWLYTTQDTGLNFVLEILRKLYEIVRDALTKMPLPCFSETFIDLFGNVLYMLKQIKLTSDLFDPVEQYLSPLKMQIAQGQDLQGLVSYTRNARRIASEVQREPVDDFLDLLDIDYQALLEVLSIPPTSTEIMETIHVFFANPDLGVILKGYLKEMTGGTSQEETIDTALNVLSFLTLPSNGQQFLEMFMDIGSEGWRVEDLDKVEKLAESLGRTIDMAMVLSDQPPLNILQRIEHMAQQLQASVSNIISQDGNNTNTAIQFLTALNSILTENFEESEDISPQVTGILQNIIGSFSSPGSQMSIASYLAAVDQTAEAFTSLFSGEVAVYFNISGQMMQAFALLEAYPGDIEKVMMSTSKISNSLNHVLALSNITSLPNGQYVQEVTHPLLLSSAMATHIIFNLSMSNYSLSSNAEREMLLTQTFNQMVVVLPKETHMYLFAIKSALFTALSKVSSTAEITSHFPEISQLVTQSLLNSLNITHDPTSTHMTPDGLVYILMTVSNQVSMSLYQGLMLSGSPIQISQAVNSLSEVASSIYSIMPVEGRPYINITLNLMETIYFVLNDTSTFGDASGAVSKVASSVNNLLAMVHHMNTNSSNSIIGDLEQTLKTILMIIRADQNPLTQAADISQQLLHTIQNLISLGNSSSVESELPKIVLGASSMNISHLLEMNDTNWTDKLPVLLTNLANSLPEDLQYSSLIKTIMRSLANESQENLHLLLQVLNTAFELVSANWANESSGIILDHLLTKVCALENMASVQLITSFLPLGPRLLCDTVVPTIQAFHVLTNNLVNQSTDIYDLIFQTFVGDPSTYNTEVDWTSTLSEIVGFDVSTLKTLNINITSPAEVKVSELLKNATLFIQDVERYTSFPPRILHALLDYSLPRNNMQILAWLANLHQCSDPSSLQLDPTGQEIFSTFCELSHEWYSITVIFLRHVDMKAALFRLVLSKEIQDLVGIMLEMVKFLTDIMHKLVPAINKLQEYLTNIGELNLVANQEFHGLVRGKRSTMSSRATFSTIARALCKNGILTLFAIAKVPIVTETDPSVQTDHKREELIKKFKIPHDASPFCMNLYLDMVNTTGGAVAWAFLKPMLLGQVLYSPDTPVTREIMRKSNSTLHQFGDLKLYASEWIESSSYVLQSADILTKTLPILQNSLRNPFVQNFIQTQTGIDVAQMSSTLSQFSNMTVLLEKNKFIMEQITTLSMLMMNLSSCVNFDRYRAFNSTDELDEQAERLAQNRELYASIIFKLPEETSSSLPLNIDYTIRMNIENVMRTDRARNPFWVKDAFMSSTKTQRYNRGFVYLQESIDRAIIEMQTGKAMDGPAVQMQAFPYPCYYKDEYLNSLAFAFPMALMTCWVLFVAHFVKKLVHERELRLHEYMKMMGVNPISHFFAWLIESAVFLLVTVIILTIILKAGGILPHSDGFVLFLYLSDYGFSVLAISFLVSSFFDKTNIAGLSGSLIYVICFFPFIVLIHLEDNLSFSVKSALSLFSPTCFSYASQYISRYEKQEEGIQWSNMYISPLAGDTSSFGWLCWLLLIDSVVYFIIGIYIRMVFPGKYGIGLPWYFPVTRSFWTDMFSCCSRTPKKIGRGLLFTNMMQEQNITDKSKGKSSLAENGEDDFSGLPVGVSLYGLTKTYDNRHAVDNLNLSFYEGHVTSLLGHNGAGKTTTMSLLTGLFAPTSGTIEVYGMDMQTSIDDVRKEMGVCMQYDVLFDHLTTKEHLLLYAQIKAPHLTKQEVNEQVRRILMETDMHSHRHKRVGTLSGGMKRKLSISIAFIGGSRLVVLDEPTTGVDPCSRRSIWDIVLQHKKERTIILSTHHLDEAEVLSDRIAFLERGGLKCCGSPFYLKDKLAQGYNLTLTKKVQTPDSNQKLNIEELRDFIQSYLPDAQQKEGEVGDLVYALPPYTPQNAAAYHSLLTGLDQNLDELQLGCYGISDTTLEEVFLQLTRDNMEPTESETWSVSESVTANDIFASRDSIPDDLNSTYFGEKASLTGTSTVRGLALTAQQVRAMLLKRVHHSRRDWKGLFSQVVLPVLFVIAAMGLGSIKSDLQHFPKIVLSPALYHIDEQYTFFSNQNPAADGLVDSMMSYPGVDHVCMRDPTDSVCKERHTIGSETWISRGNSSSTFTTCKCSNQVQSCPASDYEPPHKRNPSSQIVYNLTGINIEDYLLATANDFIRNRYGGWDFGKSLPIDLKMDMLDVPANRTLSKVWYNPEGHHTMPAYLNSLNNFILRSSLPPEKRQQYTISISSHPYPGQVQDEDVMVGGLVSILVAICVLTGYSIMTASFVIYEVHEHHTGSKRLQQISGISEPFYWIINFFYDMTLYLIPVVLSVAMIAAFQLPAFTEKQNLGAVTLLLVLFGFSTFPWMYLLSAVFKDTEMAFIGYVCINLFISVNTIISTSILYFLGQLNQNDPSIQNVYHTMSNIFLVFPQFSFGNGLMELARVDMQVQILSAFGVDAYKNPFSLDVLGWMYISMFLQGFICFTLRLLLNKTLLRKVRCWKKNVVQSYSPNEDEDVVAERLRVDRGDASADILQVKHLTKVYQNLNKRVQAVKRLSVGIPAGECFGLLGVNGAGKTTTFKMLTGDISPTDGSARIRDIDGRMVDIIDSMREGINIGYCPQVDALDDLLTGEEHLYFYARIKGISKRETDRVVNYLLKKLELNYHRHNTSESYSCGTRRKLSTALALIGNPQILLLDEPSSGMDPRSKRHLWKIISEQVMGKCAVVLTSHSMEECEALCTRLAIMVKGQFRCLGSLQHIKNRFGKGFTVKMYLAGASCDVDMISNFMQQNFPSTFLKDHHSNMVEYHVPVAPGGVASIFGLLESNKNVLQIKHFSVSQTTLDEVFINFAMGKTDTDEQEVTEGTDIDSLDSYNALDR